MRKMHAINSVSSLIQMGHPYVIVDFGEASWKTAIPLIRNRRMATELATNSKSAMY